MGCNAGLHTQTRAAFVRLHHMRYQKEERCAAGARVGSRTRQQEPGERPVCVRWLRCRAEVAAVQERGALRRSRHGLHRRGRANPRVWKKFTSPALMPNCVRHSTHVTLSAGAWPRSRPPSNVALRASRRCAALGAALGALYSPKQRMSASRLPARGSAASALGAAAAAHSSAARMRARSAAVR
jgi:hypothetical protein